MNHEFKAVAQRDQKHMFARQARVKVLEARAPCVAVEQSHFEGSLVAILVSGLVVIVGNGCAVVQQATVD